jgi:Holliday junction resolvase
MTPEGKVKKEIMSGFKRIGAYAFMPVQTGYGKRTVDILACVNGRFVAIEAKRKDGGKATALQKRTIAEVRAAGGIGLEEARAWAEVEEALCAVK